MRTLPYAKTVAAPMLLLSAIGQTQDRLPDKHNFPGAIQGPRIAPESDGFFGSLSESAYAWTSPSRVVVLTPNFRSANPPDAHDGAKAATPSRFFAFTTAFPNGPARPLEPFNTKFADYLHGMPSVVRFVDDPPAVGPPTEFRPRETRYDVPAHSFSPDGKRILFYQSDLKRWVSADLGGFHVQSWPADNEPDPVCWSADGTRWIQFHGKGDPASGRWLADRVTIHALGNGARDVRLKLESAVEPDVLGFDQAGDLLFASPYSDLDVTGDGRFGFYVAHLGRRGSAVDTVPVESFKVTFPKNEGLISHTYGVALSPDGRRLAILRGTYPDAWGRNPVLPPTGYELLLADPRATNVRSIARMIRKDGSASIQKNGVAVRVTGFREGVPMSLQWLPDSNAVSYVIDGVLYKLSVPMSAP